MVENMEDLSEKEMNKLKTEITKQERILRTNIKKRMKGMSKRKVLMELLNSEDTQLKLTLENIILNPTSGEVHMSLQNLMMVEQHSIIRQILLRILLEKEGVKIKSGIDESILNIKIKMKSEKEVTPSYIR